MPDLDPYFSSRFMHQGTSGAEFIYNEILARFAASGYRVKSRTTTDPPGSPAIFDAYIVPTGGTGDWAGFDGQFVFWYNFWYTMAPQIGFHVYVEDESVWIDFTTILASQANAIDGQVNVPLFFQSGSDRIIWDTGKGVAAYTLLTNNAIFMGPTNMRAGRKYRLRVQQDGVGSRTLTLESNKFAGSGLTNPLTIATAINAITDIYMMGPSTPLNLATIYLVEATVVSIA